MTSSTYVRPSRSKKAIADRAAAKEAALVDAIPHEAGPIIAIPAPKAKAKKAGNPIGKMLVESMGKTVNNRDARNGLAFVPIEDANAMSAIF